MQIFLNNKIFFMWHGLFEVKIFPDYCIYDDADRINPRTFFFRCKSTYLDWHEVGNLSTVGRPVISLVQVDQKTGTSCLEASTTWGPPVTCYTHYLSAKLMLANSDLFFSFPPRQTMGCQMSWCSSSTSPLFPMPRRCMRCKKLARHSTGPLT